MDKHRLFYSPTSPYARKVRVLIQELGIESEFEVTVLNPITDTGQLRAVTPLSKVPSLILNSGELVINSPVICRRLCRMYPGGNSLLATGGYDEHAVSRVEALSDGIMDAVFLHAMEVNRPASQQSDFWKSRWVESVLKTLAFIESRELESLPAQVTLAHIALECALGYIDLRLGHVEWKSNFRLLKEWSDKISQRPGFQKG